MVKAVAAVATDAAMAVSKPGGQIVDPATNTVAVALSADPSSPGTLAQVQAAVRAGMSAVAKSLGALDATGAPTRAGQFDRAGAPRKLDGPPPAGAVKAGEVCDPDNISDADAKLAGTQGLACQLSGSAHETEIPGAFQNAWKGDLILAPGDDSPISLLFRALTPPQHHSHSGIMTQNFTEITNCTSAPDRLTDADNLLPRFGQAGAGGIKPDILHFGWPGVIAQTIDEATEGSDWTDPAGKARSLAGFEPEPVMVDFVLTPSLVIKPRPEDEASVRPLLRKAADLARSKATRRDAAGKVFQKSSAYYDFFCFLKPEIALGFSDPAPAAAGWAQGMVPAVCSSFIWLCMKATGIPLVGPSPVETAGELSPDSVADGAQVGPHTLDGLFFYPEIELKSAGQVLEGIFQEMVAEHEGFARQIPFLGSDIAGDIADQIMNQFATDNPNLYGSEAWKDPGDGNAVSPDNLTFWKPPFFGHAEPLQFLPRHTEEYTVSRWTKVIVRGTVSGTVTRDGKPVANAFVEVYDGKSAKTNAAGRYELDDVPVGDYQLQARADISDAEFTAKKKISLTAKAPKLTADLALAPPGFVPAPATHLPVGLRPRRRRLLAYPRLAVRRAGPAFDPGQSGQNDGQLHPVVLVRRRGLFPDRLRDHGDPQGGRLDRRVDHRPDVKPGRQQRPPGPTQSRHVQCPEGRPASLGGGYAGQHLQLP